MESTPLNQRAAFEAIPHFSTRQRDMKKTLCTLLTAAILAPFASFAHAADGQLTRAQVRADLVQLEAVGYRPSTHDADYPSAIQSAEAKVQAMNDRTVSYGGAGSASPVYSNGAPTTHAAQ
jgi:hypothetical protein